jgi:hypothetical protein
MNQPVPLSRRPLDVLYVSFFVLNLVFITYIVDIEQSRPRPQEPAGARRASAIAF